MTTNTLTMEKKAVRKEKVKTTGYALKMLMDVAEERGLSPLVAIDICNLMIEGYKLHEIVNKPEKFGFTEEYKGLLEYMTQFDLYHVAPPTREGAVAAQAEIKQGIIDPETGMVRVKGSFVRQSQSVLSDVVGKTKKHFSMSVNGTYSLASDVEKKNGTSKVLRDLTNICFIDLHIPLEEDQQELTTEQKNLHIAAFKKGIIVELENHQEMVYEYLYQTPSQERLVQATFVSGMDPVIVLHKLGHDARIYGKLVGGKWRIDVSKYIKRPGLSGTNTIASKLIKIGNKAEYFENGDLHIVGGTHTIRFTQGTHAIVREGMYKVYNTETKEFDVLDAADLPRKLAAGDGLVFCDESVYRTLVSEFGTNSSAWQVRITPNTKGLMVFVPGLKEFYKSDILVFDTAAKGNYETLLKLYPDFTIEVRIALFNKPARFGKKYTNIPYQFLNTLAISHEECIEIANKHLDRAFDLYEDPALMSDYLGLHVLNDFENLSEDELTEDDKSVIKNTLVSRFSDFLYSGDFTMKDPMMKKYAKDIIENVIKEWSFGSIPVEGGYRFMVQDPYAILQAKILSDELDRKGKENPLRDEEGDIIIPNHLGLPAGTVFMIDSNDKFMAHDVDVVFSRNPKIAHGETAIAKTAYNKRYAEAHKKFPGAFTNLAIFSVHDFNTFKQGGADNDGDTTLCMTEPAIVEAVKESIDKFPANLDISYKDGKYVEGVPFVDPNMDKEEFVRWIPADEYTMDTARELHELSKEFVLRKLEPNDIGTLTNFATKILDAINKLRIAIKEKKTLSGAPMSPEVRQSYASAIKTYLHYIDILRLVQGWEIDKAKHGGYYKQFMDLRFIYSEDHYPVYTTGFNPFGKRVWFTPEWMAARKGRDGVDTKSLIQRVRNHVKGRFDNEIVKEFRSMNAVSSDHNIAAELALAVQKPAFYDDILRAVRAVKREYNKDIAAAIQERESNMMRLAGFIHQNGKKVSEGNKDKWESIIEERFRNKMDLLIEKSNASMSALEIEFNVEPAVLGLAAYEVTYTEENQINDNVREEKDPTKGLSFPWSGAKYHLLSAVRLASGKDMKITTVEKVAASDVKINIGGLTVDPEWIKQNALARKKIYVWNQPITDVNDPLYGYYIFNVYIGRVKVGSVFADKAHAFSGHDKWEVNIKDASYKVNAKTNEVRSMTFTLDSAVPYTKK